MQTRRSTCNPSRTCNEFSCSLGGHAHARQFRSCISNSAKPITNSQFITTTGGMVQASAFLGLHYCLRCCICWMACWRTISGIAAGLATNTSGCAGGAARRSAILNRGCICWAGPADRPAGSSGGGTLHGGRSGFFCSRLFRGHVHLGLQSQDVLLHRRKMLFSVSLEDHLCR